MFGVWGVGFRFQRGLERGGVQFENNHFTEMYSVSEAGSYLRLIDFVFHSTLGVRAIKKREERTQGSGFRVWVIQMGPAENSRGGRMQRALFLS